MKYESQDEGLPKRKMRNGGLNETVIWCGRRMEISRNDHVRNEEVLTF
jgi:hypothetical protein